MVELGPGSAFESVDDAAGDVPDVRGAFAKIVVVDAGQDVGLFGRRPVDGLGRRRPGIDQRKRGPDDPWVAGEQCLGFENRSDLVAGPAGGLTGEGGQLVGRGVERRKQPFAFGGRVRSSWLRRAIPSVRRRRRQPQQPAEADAS
jgi:hypothetical protein